VMASVSAGMRWSLVSMLGRDVSRTIFTIFLARLVGPDQFGIAAQALVCIGIISMFLDQGFSLALIQRRHIESKLPGATVTVNLAIGAALAGLTVAVAPWWAGFMNSPQLAIVLIVLASSLLIRSVVITPRAMLMRNMEFRTIGIADSVAAIAGGLLGLAVALIWTNYWAVVAQVVVTDVITVVMFLAFGAGYRPNLSFRELRAIAAFSWRAFATGILINSISQNIDNVLIGRVYGATALAMYGMGYRLLLLPVQLAISSVGAVLLPTFSRLADDVTALAAEMARATRLLAVLSMPSMALVAAAAPQLVTVVFGSAWLPAVPIVQVLAFVGALQATYKPTTASLMLGTGRAKLALRYAWLTTIAITVAVVSGLAFGAFGVAVAYAVVTAALLPLEWLIRRRILCMPIRTQVGVLLPAVHVAVAAAAAYLLIAFVLGEHPLIVIAAGLPLAGVAGLAVLRVLYPALLAEMWSLGMRITGRRVESIGNVE
jgi:O-antigen/teichoic acid export membrane protein